MTRSDSSATAPKSFLIPAYFGKSFWVLLGVGIMLRVASLLLLLNVPLDPDAGAYLNFARRFEWTDFWEASIREPLWVGLIKIATAPFAYSAASIRVFTTILSVAVLLASWNFFTLVASPRLARIAFAIVCFNGLLIFLAPRGLREELVTCLILVFASSTIAWLRGESKAWPVAVSVGLTAAVRLEIALLLLVALVVVIAVVRRGWQVLLAAVLIAVVLVGPWFASNYQRYGDATYSSVPAAVWFRNRELADRGHEISSPYEGSKISWSEYYLDFLGPGESLKRTIIGVPALTGSLLYQFVFPIRQDRLYEIAPFTKEPVDIVPILRIAAILFVVIAVGLALAAVVVRGTYRRMACVSAGAVLCGIVIYAPLSRHLEVNYRLVAFATPFVVLPIARGILLAYERVRGTTEGAT